MPTEITVPRLGWSMEEALFSGWLKHEGDLVRAGDPLFALESDKATQEVESFDSGRLHLPPTAPGPGDKVIVGQRIGYLLAANESIPISKVLPVTPKPPTADLPVPAVTRSQAALPSPPTPTSTPRARRAARELGRDWTSVVGTGRGGRIREADVRHAGPSYSTRVLTSNRRLIAERMVASHQTTAPVTLHTTADATALVHLRQSLKTERPPTNCEALVPSYNDMLVKLVASALGEHPVLNSRWEGDTLVHSTSIHVGLAVDTETGLLVPVIRDVPALSLNEVASRAQKLTERARSGRLNAEELRGGTFTLTSLGALGIDAFTPIINYPECAILGIGRIRRLPVVVENAIELRDMMTLSLTFDHRACDGAPAARFLQTLTRLIQSPTKPLNFSSTPALP